jgi:hypothetical protein
MFTLNTPVPKSATMQLTAPVGVYFYEDTIACTVTTNTMKTNVCRFIGSTVIQIRSVFPNNDYTGPVTISFNAYNPPDNLQMTQSLKLEVFSDSSFQYLVALIDDGLAPRTNCNYPCLTCDPMRPD